MPLQILTLKRDGVTAGDYMAATAAGLPPVTGTQTHPLMTWAATAVDPRSTGSLLESSERAQVKHELAVALTDLGGATFALAYHGALDDERLVPRIQRIRDLFTQLSTLDHPTRTGQPVH
jgi:hypothetical protein